MKIFLYNTLTRKKEEFKPIKDKTVGLYTCGPTVYDYAHIGNLRTYIFEDVLRRTLEMDKFKVDQVMNITDVDDKTILASQGDKKEFEKLTQKYEEAFFFDLKKLNIKKAQNITQATKYIDKMVDFIADLIDQGYAYKGGDGSIYYSIKKFKDYGKLAHLDRNKLKVGARVRQDEYSKENPADFALWKAWDKADGKIFWETKLGKGRPGWHIECSTMSQDKLGKTIDIHTGGVDNIFPHHENEIAQSEARTGKKFVNYWLHGEHLLVNNKKMAKSEHNFIKLEEIEDYKFFHNGDNVGSKGSLHLNSLALRYLFLEVHYRKRASFTWDSFESARISLGKINDKIKGYSAGAGNGKILNKYKNEFLIAINDDLNTPQALAVLWRLIRSDEKKKDKYVTILDFDKVLGLGLGLKKGKANVSVRAKRLVGERDLARTKGDFKKADSIRKELAREGIKIEDTPDGTKVLME